MTQLTLDQIEDVCIPYFTVDKKEQYATLVIQLQKLLGNCPEDKWEYFNYLVRKASGFGGIFASETSEDGEDFKPLSEAQNRNAGILKGLRLENQRFKEKRQQERAKELGKYGSRY